MGEKVSIRIRELVKVRYAISLMLFFLASLALAAAEPVDLLSEVIGDSFPSISESLWVREGRSLSREDGRFWGCADCFGPFKVTASDSLETSDQDSYSASNLVDNESQTCWAARGGNGNWFAFSWGRPGLDYWPVDSFTLVNGYAKTPNRWRQNSRIRELEISIDGQPRWRVTLHDTPRVQTVRFPSRLNIHAQEMRFTVLSIYPGSYYNDLCVSEFQLEGGH